MPRRDRRRRSPGRRPCRICPPEFGAPAGSVAVRDVILTASGTDLLAPWIDQYNAASENATALLNNFYFAPNVGLQQFVANWSGFLQDWFNNPSSSTVAAINEQIQANLGAVS